MGQYAGNDWLDGQSLAATAPGAAAGSANGGWEAGRPNCSFRVAVRNGSPETRPANVAAGGPRGASTEAHVESLTARDDARARRREGYAGDEIVRACLTQPQFAEPAGTE